jgi:hypothetical protein
MAIRAISVKYLGWRFSGGALQILSYTRATTTKLPTFFLLSVLWVFVGIVGNGKIFGIDG